MSAPGSPGKWALSAATATWVGALAGLAFGAPVIVLVLGGAVASAVLTDRRFLVIGLFCVAGAASGTLAAQRMDATTNSVVPSGPVVVRVQVVEDPGGLRPVAVAKPLAVRRGGRWQSWSGPSIGLQVPNRSSVRVGDVVEVAGRMSGRSDFIRGDPVAGTLHVSRLLNVERSSNPLLVVGNAVRERTRSVTASDSSPERALLLGLLIGDTTDVSPSDRAALRRSGLSHYVAVSGSNVALFLAAWWVVTAPFALHRRLRAVTGLIGLAIFVIVTRWEASVLRAATMAGVLLGASAASLAIDAWVALGTAVTMLILMSGQLASDVGFQLSVAATCGVLAGAGMFRDRRPKAIWTVVGATISAQAAVVPLLLIHFGSVPLLAPLANVLAAPLVVAATTIGGIGAIIGWDVLVAAASWIAGGVLAIARSAETWPQLDGWSVLLVGVAGAAAIRLRPARPVVGAVLGLVLLAQAFSRPGPPDQAQVTFLDVGQGDAVLLQTPDGGVALIDGGRDQVVLHEALRRFGVGRIDLLVVTHGDDDHLGGLEGLTSRVSVVEIWIPGRPEPGSDLELFSERAGSLGSTVTVPAVGDVRPLDGLTIEVLGPRRRYQSRNDGSIVLWVEADRSVLLAGDVEAVAQRELPDLRPDLMLVPHHGSATTDPEWLGRTVGPVAVVSVGPNRYGHPAPEILEILAASGTDVLTTARHGDITVALESEP